MDYLGSLHGHVQVGCSFGGACEHEYRPFRRESCSNVHRNSTAGGVNVDASATVTPGAGTLSVSITNDLVNQTSVGQNVSDLEISLDGMLTGSPTYNGTQTNATANVTSNGTFITGMTAATWALSSPTSNQILLDALGAGPQTPAFTLLGAPGPSGYSSANGLDCWQRAA